jgi:hypothetical protein
VSEPNFPRDYVQAIAEAMKRPFRPNPDTGELSRATEDWKARSATTRVLIAIGNSAHHLDEALLDLRNTGVTTDESVVDEHLRILWVLVRALFPGVVAPVDGAKTENPKPEESQP